MVKCSNIWRDVGTFNRYGAQKTLMRQRERRKSYDEFSTVNVTTNTVLNKLTSESHNYGPAQF